MSKALPIHYVVARSRAGYAVCVEADLMSEHTDAAEARLAAHLLAQMERDEGRAAVVVDLTAAAPFNARTYRA